MKRLIKKSHFDNIHALRFIAVLWIFISHCFVTNNEQVRVSSLFTDVRQVSINLNHLAYSLLFILTGFLNTWTIFEERFIYKKMNVLRFYMRRILGILPLYLVIFLLGFFLLPALSFDLPVSQSMPVDMLQYLLLFFNFSYFDTYSPLDGVLGNMWSIAVTMQFILVWPILMTYFRRKESTLIILGLLAFGAGAWFYYEPDKEQFRYNTLNILCDFMAGAFVAYFSFFKYKTHIFLKKQTKRTIGFIYLVFFAIIIFKSRILFRFHEVPPQVLFIVERLLLTAALAFFLFEQTFSSNSVLKLSKLKIFNPPGKIAYSIYAYHAFGIILGYKVLTFLVSEQSQLAVLLFLPLISLAITSVIALFSTEYFEKKFTRRKKNYNPTREYNPVGLQDVKTKSA
ncbi:MAG: acyltransferase [Bacteroidia bacterium]